MLSHRVLLVLFPLISFSASAQSVISAHSGVIHYCEGVVFIGDQRVEQRLGRFSEIKEGSELRTETGRAEILLTPGTFLRVDENSSIRMLSTRLTDTRVEFIGGSAILESVKAALGTAVVIVYKDSEIRVHSPGLYRLDSTPPGLRVEQGEADVLSAGRALTLKQGQALAFSGTPAVSQFTSDSGDALETWSRRRSLAVAASDAAAAEAEDMAVLLNAPAGDMLILSPYDTCPYSPIGAGAYPGGYIGYTGLAPWRPSIYAPRIHTYSPLGYSGYQGYRSSPLIRSTTPVPFHPPSRTYAPPAASRPVMAAPAAPHSGVRGGGHR